MKDSFDEEQDLSQVKSETVHPTLELNPRQRDIVQNLEAIGPEIAGYYRDGLRIEKYAELETTASLLAHIAREIDGGLRDILSDKNIKEEREEEISPEILEQLNVKGGQGHIASILVALDIDVTEIQSSPDDPRIRLASKWINVATQFHKFSHRHGAWKSPRSRTEFEDLWYEFETVLTFLVGSTLDLLSRLDRILVYETPTKEITETLKNLLQSVGRYEYFFGKLESPAWLAPLKTDGWFNPDQNPKLQEDPEAPGNFYHPIWHALRYVAKVSTHQDTDKDVLVDIVNAIIDSESSEDRVANRYTDFQIIRIIGALPIDRVEHQHIGFMDIVLRSKSWRGLVDQEVGQKILPKLLAGNKRELTLALLEIMLAAKYVGYRIHTTMNLYWLEDALKENWKAIANLCGTEALEIALTQIRALASENLPAFHFLPFHPDDSRPLSRADYPELIVDFTNNIFRDADPMSIEETIQGLLQEQPVIIRRIAVKAISDHYSSLKHLFWEWQGNPLDAAGLVPVISDLIQTNSHTFSESEMEQILQWIESTEN